MAEIEQLSKKKILIVEDRNYFSKKLRRYSYRSWL